MDQLLATKLFIPTARSSLVPRPRLIEQLNEGLQSKLTLISAPAGFGKTTLVTEWLDNLHQVSPDEEVPLKIAWLSLDEHDNKLVRFLGYFISALNQSIGDMANIGGRTQGFLQSAEIPAIEVLLTPLINEITKTPARILFVLDDYHLIEHPQVNEVLSFLINNMPSQLHLVVATREDPHFPLSRLRARGEITELRSADLRFSALEASQFLNQVSELSLSEKDINALENRTEGWIAGLQLAAISLRGREDSTAFIDSFTGSHRLVLDYLIEEVLNQQSQQIQTFLLKTAILEQLNSALCEVITGDEDSQEILEMLDRSNLFLIPLDNERRWYRYHHLFSDVLQTRLKVVKPGELKNLHLRASEWFEKEGLWSESIDHALAAEDYQGVARIAEISWETMDGSFQSDAWLDWVKKIPDDLIRNRPVLCNQYAWALWMAGELEASEARLKDAERWLDLSGKIPALPSDPLEGMVVYEQDQYRVLPARIAVARSYNAQAVGDISNALKYAEIALELTPENADLERAQATVSLGFLNWSDGNLESALAALESWQRSMMNFGNVTFAIATTFAIADILIELGRLKDAQRAYIESLGLADQQNREIDLVTPHLYLGLAMLYHEMGDEQLTAQNLQICKQLGERSTLPDWPFRWSFAQARLKEDAGDLETAIDLLNEAKRLHVRVSVPEYHPIEAHKAHIYLQQGYLSRAREWVQQQELSADDELNYLREYEHIILCRVLIAEFENSGNNQYIDQAIDLMARLLTAANESSRLGSVIDILLLQSLAFHTKGDKSPGNAALERALTLGEKQGYLRVFINEGARMAELLRSLPVDNDRTARYVSRLLHAFESKETRPGSTDNLVEQLSERELEVLRLLDSNLTGPEIAGQLMIELSTFRSHTKSIYRKLDVSSRRAAVRKATELHFI